jgi:hypothetical protein
MEMKRFSVHLLSAAVLAAGTGLAAERWVAAGNMLHVRQDHTATLLKNGKVLVTGWNSNEAELYNPASGAFEATGQTAHNHRDGCTATLLNSGKVLIAGGSNALQIAEIYDPATGLFGMTGAMNFVHSYHTATLLADGKVLIAGGQDQAGPQTHAVAEIYDPQTGIFSLTGSLVDRRSGHAAALLPNGKVLIAGGLQTTSPGLGYYLDTCEMYDPASGVFNAIQPLKNPRVGHAATLLTSGRVLVSGGAYYQNAGEIFDTGTGAWTLTGPMKVVRRSYHTAVLLRDGRVLLAGGLANAATRTAEIFDPKTNAFTAADSMLSARSSHRAVRLTDGSVLVTGGYDGDSTIAKAERFLADTATAVHADPSNRMRADSHALFQNYPNPFNPETRIDFMLINKSEVTLSVFDVAGRRVAVLASGVLPAGRHTAVFDGGRFRSGVYYCSLEAEGLRVNRKMLLIK